jgi:hypothetical protein
MGKKLKTSMMRKNGARKRKGLHLFVRIDRVKSGLLKEYIKEGLSSK